MKRNWQRFLILTVVIILVGSGLAKQTTAVSQKTEEDRLAEQKLYRQFIDAVDLIRDNYLEEVDYEILTKVGIQGMLRTLDPHSSFYDRKAFDDLKNDQRSQYFGIGSVIGTRDGKVFIQEPFKDTPSYRAGLRYGDQIASIDGENTEAWSSTQVTSRLRGEQGTKVKVGVKRAGVAEPVFVTIERDAIAQLSITGAFLVRPGIGYINMPRGFHSTTSDELTAAIAYLKDQGATSMIFDLRDNPGGFLHEAIKVSDKFLQRGQTVLSVRYREGKLMDRELPAESGSPETFPLVVLINKDSASASEIVAGAIQDHDRGLIVGETSFGKGLVQTIIPLSGGAGLTLTTARYYTPSGRLIQRDYSSNSMYEYYGRRSLGELGDETRQKANKVWLTDLKRPVYGGGGINPDVKVKDTKVDNVFILNQTQVILLSPIFLFARDVLAGVVPAAPDYRVTLPAQHDHRLKPNEFVVNDAMMKAYREFLTDWLKKHPEVVFTAAQIDENLAWTRNRIRYELLLGAYGGDKAQQAMVEADAQLQRAIVELPNAAALADKARQKRSVSRR